MSKLPDSKFTSGPLLSWDIFINSYQKKLAYADDYSSLAKLSAKNNWMDDWDIETKLFREEKVIIVTNTILHISFASSNIYEMNGYTPKELIGKTPKIFQGVATSSETLKTVNSAIQSRKPFDVSVLNYKKNGDTYKCRINGYPVFNKTRELVNYIAFESVHD
jgi:PAS domain S-box-containing protein